MSNSVNLCRTRPEFSFPCSAWERTAQDALRPSRERTLSQGVTSQVAPIARLLVCRRHKRVPTWCETLLRLRRPDRQAIAATHVQVRPCRRVCGPIER